MARIGLFGGSFNPVHCAHLILAECAREGCRLDRVVFVPVGTPPHKPNLELAPARERLRMLELALAGNPHFEVSTIELDREGPSYTLVTVREFRRGLKADDRLFLVMGADSVRDLPTWWHARELVDEVEVIALARPGVSLRRLPELDAVFGAETVRRIRRSLVKAPLLEISSTDIRERVRQGRSIRYFAPAPVCRHILDHGLYASG